MNYITFNKYQLDFNNHHHLGIYFKCIIITFLLCFANIIILNGQNFDADKIPDPRSICSKCYVSNPDKFLSEQTVASINSKLYELEKLTSAQVAVVVVNGDKETDARELSMTLFDLWHVGSKGKDNGLIIVLAIQSRYCFIRTGYGLEGAVSDAKATQIVHKFMSPSLAKEDWDKGILDGVNAIYDLIIKEYNETGFATNENVSNDIISYIIVHFAVSLFIFMVSVIRISKSVRMFSNNQKEEKLRYVNSKIVIYLIINFVFLPSLLCLLIWIYGYLYRKIRKSIVICNCGNKMKLLSEKEEDTYLNDKQQMEESLKSKDYDVWLCDKCGTKAIYSYNKALTSYSVCPFCGAKTYFQASNSIVMKATNLSDGVGRKIFMCKHCGKTQSSDYRIPASGTFVSGSGFGGSSSGFGGGWGGGFSGGGGGGGHF
ncbi:MAG: TPM domain-containing protein [Bacteroidales bacterium]|nr:TPM domain-containing protein [Bacteroidales bacterium]